MNKRILSKAIVLLLLTGLLVSLISLDSTQTGKVAAQQTGLPKLEANVPVRGTYLFADNDAAEWDDNGDGIKEKHYLDAPLIVNLAANGFAPGDTIKLNATGAVHYAANADWNLFWSGASELWGVFSSSVTILWQTQGNEVGPLHRVPGAINAGEPFVTPATFNGYPTDIPEDFFVPEEGARIRIPPGAAYLILCGSGSKYTDNDGWIKATIEVTDKDTDGDGLLDSWEKNGIDYNEDGITDLYLPDADWQHKDLFVEVDYMPGHYPDANAMADVKSAFANAPITNPDGIPGIRLHIDVDEPVPHQNLIKRDFTKGFDGLKELYFGNATQRSDLNSLNVLEAKNLVYRYCIFVHKISQWNGTHDVETNYAGLGEMPGNDFIVAAGSFDGGLKTIRDDHAGGFMHELGHNLGLNHGGDVSDGINFKPNYLSVMNYAFAFSTLVPWRPLDYSRKQLFALYEGSLDETYGIQASGFWQYTIWNDTKQGYVLGFIDRPKDWNGNGNVTERSVRANINNFPLWDYSSAADEVLFGYDDWANVKLAFGDTSQFAHGVHLQMSGDEITSDIVEAMRQSVLEMHEVAVFNLTSSSAIWSQGNALSVNLTLGNLGGSDENVNVTVYANTTMVASSSLVVKAGNLTTITLPYTGQALNPGAYLLKASVSQVAGETYTADNTVTGATITVTDVIPEFPPSTLLAAIIVLTLAVSLAFRRKANNGAKKLSTIFSL